MRENVMRVLVGAVVVSAALLAPVRSAWAQGAARPGVLVHVDGPSGLELQRDLDSMHAGSWETVCAAPCDVQVRSELRYRVAGAGRKATAPFELTAPEGGRERIAVSGGSKAWFILGWIGVGVGGGVALVGMEVLLAPVLASSVPGADGRLDSSSHAGHPVLGWTLLGAGVALAVASLTLAVEQRHTLVTQDVTPPASEPSTKRAVPERARVAAAPREDALAVSLPRPILLPLVDLRF